VSAHCLKFGVKCILTFFLHTSFRLELDYMNPIKSEMFLGDVKIPDTDIDVKSHLKMSCKSIQTNSLDLFGMSL